MGANNIQLTNDDKRAILRAADEVIGQGGRTLLTKILKGSREKKILQLELDQCPTYGYFHSESLEKIIEKVDWMIDYGFLDIEYSGRLPMIVFTEKGWEIERDQRADEFLQEWDKWLLNGETSPDMMYLKDRNREMILLFLEKVRATGDQKYIPYLKKWEKIDYKQVAERIREICLALETNEAVDEALIQEKRDAVEKALAGTAPQDLLLKCWRCGERFVFTVGEQQFYKQKGFVDPKKCEKCRGEE